MRKSWAQLFFKSMHNLLALLRPSTSTCLICGRNDHRMASALPSLCSECRESIPWISRIHCPICGRPERCGDCGRRHTAAFICNRSAVQYNDTIRQWLALYKYRGHEGLEPLLGELLWTAYSGLLEEFSQRSKSFRIDAVVHVPVSTERLLERGFNQAERLAAYIAKQGGLLHFDILRRARHSEKQSFKTRGERLRDSRELFVSDGPATLKMMDRLFGGDVSALPARLNSGESVRLLLVDDIYTTGSTVNACARAVREGVNRAGFQMHIEIYTITLARS